MWKVYCLKTNHPSVHILATTSEENSEINSYQTKIIVLICRGLDDDFFYPVPQVWDVWSLTFTMCRKIFLLTVTQTGASFVSLKCKIFLPGMYSTLFLVATNLRATYALEKCSNVWGSQITCWLKIIVSILRNFEPENREKFKQQSRLWPFSGCL